MGLRYVWQTNVFSAPIFLDNTFFLGWVSQGGKQTRVVWMDAVDKLGAVGFDKSSMRQFMMWDPRNTAEPFHTLDLDQSAGAIMPFYDNDVNVRICVSMFGCLGVFVTLR